MSFETKSIDLAGGPVDMTAHPVIAAAIAAAADGRLQVFCQNVSPRAKVYIASRSAEPARSDKGHCMLAGDGFELSLFANRPFWAWVASTGCIAISPLD